VEVRHPQVPGQFASGQDLVSVAWVDQVLDRDLAAQAAASDQVDHRPDILQDLLEHVQACPLDLGISLGRGGIQRDADPATGADRGLALASGVDLDSVCEDRAFASPVTDQFQSVPQGRMKGRIPSSRKTEALDPPVGQERDQTEEVVARHLQAFEVLLLEDPRGVAPDAVDVAGVGRVDGHLDRRQEAPLEDGLVVLAIQQSLPGVERVEGIRPLLARGICASLLTGRGGIPVSADLRTRECHDVPFLEDPARGFSQLAPEGTASAGSIPDFSPSLPGKP